MAKKPVKPVSKVSAVEVAEVVDKVSKLPADNLITSFGKLQLEAQTSIADLSAKVLSGKNTLDEINLAIDDANNRLQNLYNVESALFDLEQVRLEIQSERDAWESEKNEEEQERLREEELYTYNMGIKRRNEADKIAENHKIREDALKLRELDLKNREAEIAELRKTVDGIPTLLKKEVDKEVAAATNSLKKTYEHEKALAAKDAENAKKESEFKVQALVTQIEQLKSHQGTLYEQLEAATNNAKEIAKDALHSRSGYDALNAVQKTLETTANNATGKR